MKIFLVISLFLYSGIINGQKLKEEFKYKVTYDMTYVLDSTDLSNKKVDRMLLFIGDDYSAYSSRARLFKGSVVVKGNAGRTSRESITDFPYLIIKSLKTKQLYYTLQIVDDFFYYEQSSDLFNWTLLSETKEINGYKAQKATTTYSGRDYIAWFTPEIPFAEGPFKFNGLPGLILEIHDTQEHYYFKLTSFEKVKKPTPFRINLKNYISTTKEEIFEVWFRYRRDPFTYVNNPNVSMTPEVHKKYIQMFTEKIEKENNRIERN
jgi:GLPGLI family protein